VELSIPVGDLASSLQGVRVEKPFGPGREVALTDYRVEDGRLTLSFLAPSQGGAWRKEPGRIYLDTGDPKGVIALSTSVKQIEVDASAPRRAIAEANLASLIDAKAKLEEMLQDYRQRLNGPDPLATQRAENLKRIRKRLAEVDQTIFTERLSLGAKRAGLGPEQRDELYLRARWATQLPTVDHDRLRDLEQRSQRAKEEIRRVGPELEDWRAHQRHPATHRNAALEARVDQRVAELEARLAAAEQELGAVRAEQEQLFARPDLRDAVLLALEANSSETKPLRDALDERHGLQLDLEVWSKTSLEDRLTQRRAAVTAAIADLEPRLGPLEERIAKAQLALASTTSDPLDVFSPRY
jgi:hypothetical protein